MALMKQRKRLEQKREIRVFVSSTFRDMREEREELVKRVFPQLRKLCEERGVVWRKMSSVLKQPLRLFSEQLECLALSRWWVYPDGLW